MFAYELPLDPPVDDYEMIDALVKTACEEYLGISYKSRRFENIYDLMFEEIRENLHKYLPENDFDCE